MRRQISKEHFKQFHEIAPRYYSWDIILRDAGIKRVADKGDQYEIPCPLHDDYSPSMRLTKSNGLYHCFSCGAKGGYTKFLWELSGRSVSYSQFCEQILKSNPSMQAELGFSSLFVSAKSLDPVFNKRRVFNPKAHLGSDMPITSLASKVRGLDDSWDSLALSLSLLQQGIPTDNVYSAVKRRTLNLSVASERVSVMDLLAGSPIDADEA